jgi:hypothetical protein
MASTANRREGLYVSYNEGLATGPIDAAVEISNRYGCVAWIDPSALKPNRLKYPTDIIVRLSGQERYFRGILLAVANWDSLPAEFMEREVNHRPVTWRNTENGKSVLFISHLREVSKPQETVGIDPNQRPVYVLLTPGRSDAWGLLADGELR